MLLHRRTGGSHFHFAQGVPENQALLARERSQQNGLAELRFGHHRVINGSAGLGDEPGNSWALRFSKRLLAQT